MMRTGHGFFTFALFFLFSLLLPQNAEAQRGIDVKKTGKRIALIIGNAKYSHISALRNPENDATDVAEALESLDFEVILAVNQTGNELGETLEQFEEKSHNADVALLYYAGHGIQYQGQNFIIPVDAKMTSKYKIRRETFPINDVIQGMERNAKMSLVFLDACRNNPLREDIKRSLNLTRSAAGGGLAPMKTGDAANTLIVFAAKAGKVAEDGAGRNSPFTTAFLKHMPTPNVEIEVMLKDVTNDVFNATGGKQKPQRLSELRDKFFFKGNGKNALPLPPNYNSSEKNGRLSNNQYCSMQYHKALSSSNRRTALSQFISRCPTHKKVKSAEILFEELADAENCEKCLHTKSLKSCQYYRIAHPKGLCIKQAQAILKSKLNNEDQALEREYTTNRRKKQALYRAIEQEDEQKRLDDIRAQRKREESALRRSRRDNQRLEQEQRDRQARRKREREKKRRYNIQKKRRQAALIPKPPKIRPSYNQKRKNTYSCVELWISRNAISNNKGYCFKSNLGKSFFDNSDCRAKKFRLSKNERYRIQAIRQNEKSMGCNINTNRFSHKTFMETCIELWVARNSISNNKGYCFKSNLGKSFFDNSDCHTTHIKFSNSERNKVSSIQKRENFLGCKVKTN